MLKVTILIEVYKLKATCNCFDLFNFPCFLPLTVAGMGITTSFDCSPLFNMIAVFPYRTHAISGLLKIAV